MVALGHTHLLLVAAIHFQICSTLIAQDVATVVNLPLAVSFTDADPGAGSYGGTVDWLQRVRKSD